MKIINMTVTVCIFLFKYGAYHSSNSRSVVVMVTHACVHTQTHTQQTTRLPVEEDTMQSNGIQSQNLFPVLLVFWKMLSLW